MATNIISDAFFLLFLKWTCSIGANLKRKKQWPAKGLNRELNPGPPPFPGSPKKESYY
jgi:hypothetical protein